MPYIEPLPSAATVRVPLNYSRYDGPEDGAHYHVFPVEGKPQTNIETVSQSVDLKDLRGSANEANLDVHGFQFLSDVSPSEEKEFKSEETVKAGPYYAEIEALLREHLRFDKFSLFDNTVRRTSDEPEAPGKRQPLPKVHVDQSESAAQRRVHLHMPEDAAEILETGQRVRIVNTWRPISSGPVVDKPLAFADYRTIDPKRDFFRTARIAPERTGETLGVRYSEEHQWYYLSDMTSSDVALIKCYDSKPGMAVYTPHSAFILDPPEPFVPRASVEVRALLIGG